MRDFLGCVEGQVRARSWWVSGCFTTYTWATSRVSCIVSNQRGVWKSLTPLQAYRHQIHRCLPFMTEPLYLYGQLIRFEFCKYVSILKKNSESCKGINRESSMVYQRCIGDNTFPIYLCKNTTERSSSWVSVGIRLQPNALYIGISN